MSQCYNNLVFIIATPCHEIYSRNPLRIAEQKDSSPAHIPTSEENTKSPPKKSAAPPEMIEMPKYDPNDLLTFNDEYLGSLS